LSHSLLARRGAQDACLAICQVLDYLQYGAVKHLVQAASYAIDSVDLYVQEIENMHPNSKNLEQQILGHPLMQMELHRQREAIEQLAKLNEHNKGEWEAFKKRWRNPGTGCLEFECEDEGRLIE
jgi:gentisate 1,2-dioxygenase